MFQSKTTLFSIWSSIKKLHFFAQPFMVWKCSTDVDFPFDIFDIQISARAYQPNLSVKAWWLIEEHV